MPRRLFPTSGVPSRRLMDMREASGAVRGRLTSEDVARLLGERKPILMVTDPPYGIELDSEWRDRAGLNGHGPAEQSYMKHRTKGHTETTISGDTRADWSETFELVHDQQIIWDKGRTVLTRTLYWFAQEPCWFVRSFLVLHFLRTQLHHDYLPQASQLCARAFDLFEYSFGQFAGVSWAWRRSVVMGVSRRPVRRLAWRLSASLSRSRSAPERRKSSPPSGEA